MNERAEISTSSLTKSYGDFTAVDHLSIAARNGELLALLGPNGAGKTTLMRMLAGFLKPTQGTITILGQTGSGIRPKMRRHVGYCPQRLIIWQDLTCLEQLRYQADMFCIPRKRGKERALALLEILGLAKKANALAAHLSGGMQRRLSLALAMVHDPPIYILDEPEAGLDPQSRILVRDRIRAQSRDLGKTVLLSTHDMEEAERLAERVAIIDRGKLLAVDTPKFLIHKHGKTRLLEISLGALPGHRIDAAFTALKKLGAPIRRHEEHLTLDAEDGAELMRPVRTILAKISVEPREIRLRRRTLEDVFIDLTGKGLRE
jgi:ABC-2 type transport system ATP-binding protein